MGTSYIAASFPRREEARTLARELIQRGETVQARWLFNDSPGYEQGEQDWEAYAVIDYDDVAACTTLVVLTGDSLSRGGRHTELGIALALDKRIALIGLREQIFHFSPKVVLYNDVSAYLASL